MLLKQGLVLAVVLVLCSGQGFQVRYSQVRTPIGYGVEEGGMIRLRCRANGWYRHCIWRHEDKNCHFRWLWTYDEVRKQSCSPELEERVAFVGDYNNNICEIIVRDLDPSDAGNWVCEMEAYTIGVFSGTVGSSNVTVTFDEKPDMETIENEIN